MRDETEQLCCGNCGIIFAVPKHWADGRREDGSTWFCPNGHPRVFNKGKRRLEILEEELRRERQLAAQVRGRAEAAEAAEADARRREAAAKRQVASLKKKATEGECPCCARSFGNLRAHMARQHPEFKAEAAE